MLKSVMHVIFSALQYEICICAHTHTHTHPRELEKMFFKNIPNTQVFLFQTLLSASHRRHEVTLGVFRFMVNGRACAWTCVSSKGWAEEGSVEVDLSKRLKWVTEIHKDRKKNYDGILNTKLNGSLRGRTLQPTKGPCPSFGLSQSPDSWPPILSLI